MWKRHREALQSAELNPQVCSGERTPAQRAANSGFVGEICVQVRATPPRSSPPLPRPFSLRSVTRRPPFCVYGLAVRVNKRPYIMPSLCASTKKDMHPDCFPPVSHTLGTSGNYIIKEYLSKAFKKSA